MRIIQIAAGTPEPANPLEVSPGRIRAQWSWDCFECGNLMRIGPNGLPLKEIEDENGQTRYYQSYDDECPFCYSKDYKRPNQHAQHRRSQDPYGRPYPKRYPYNNRMPAVKLPSKDIPLEKPLDIWDANRVAQSSIEIVQTAGIGPGVDWGDADWTKSDIEIAANLGVSPASVAARRRKPKFDINSVDWTKSSFSIHKETGINLETVNALKIIMATGWENSNEEIAQSGKLSAKRVAQLRQIFAPDTIKKRNIDNNDYSNVNWSMTNTDLARQFRVTPSTIHTQRRIHAPNTIDGMHVLYDWASVDWNMTDRQIAKVLLNQVNPGELQDVKRISQLTGYVTANRPYRAPDNLKQEMTEKQPTAKPTPRQLFMGPYDRVAQSTFGITVLGGDNSTRVSMHTLQQLQEQSADVPFVINALVKEYGISPAEINDGACCDFAVDLASIIGGTVRFASSRRDMPGEDAHCWLEHGGKCYDAEHPNGATSWRELTYVKKNPDFTGKVYDSKHPIWRAER